jgi:uncharacterized protein (DUF1697 family)
MTVFVAFLRGINVGGNKTISMSTLKTVFESLGLSAVKTHLNSGNVVFATSKSDREKLARTIETAVEKEFGFRAVVLLRSAVGLRNAVVNNPFRVAAEKNPSRLVVMFLAETPAKDALRRIEETYKGPEEIVIDGDVAYVTYPNGIGKSKLTNVFLEKRLGVSGTARNWNTVTKLLQLAEAAERS